MSSVSLRERDLMILRTTLRRFPSVRRARIFGSRATGTARRASDIDLAIEAPGASPGEWRELCEALNEAPLIYQLDILRAERVSDPRLREKIEREGVIVYPDPEPDRPAPGDRITGSGTLVLGVFPTKQPGKFAGSGPYRFARFGNTRVVHAGRRMMLSRAERRVPIETMRAVRWSRLPPASGSPSVRERRAFGGL